jgi:hypothetical protein
MSMSPFAAGAAGGLAAVHGAQRIGHGAKRAPGMARGAVHASQATDRGVRKAGRTAVDATKSAGKAVVMAPVIVPARVGRAQAARDDGNLAPRKDRVRARFAQARQSRAQWRRNVAHPVRATRDASASPRNRDTDATDWM